MQIYNYISRRPVVFNLEDIKTAFYGERCESITIYVGGDRPQILTFSRELHGDKQFFRLERKLGERGLL